MERTIKIGTRGSLLAVAQAEIAARRLQEENPNWTIELIKITTKGDRILDRTIDKVGGKGVFVKEIETALLDGEIDIAVHSMKDLPQEFPDGLCLGAVLAREEPWDALVTKGGARFFSLPAGAVIGTGSLRRQMQIRALRDDIQVEPIRGNIHTRLSKLEEGFDGIVLAAAGLRRVGLLERVSYQFSLSEMVPAACQGILALEIRRKDADLGMRLQHLEDVDARYAAEAERGFLQAVGADCHAPVGAYAAVGPEEIHITGYYAGKRLEGRGTRDCARELGYGLGKKMLQEAGQA